jgi:hypothetical protein
LLTDETKVVAIVASVVPAEPNPTEELAEEPTEEPTEKPTEDPTEEITEETSTGKE